MKLNKWYVVEYQQGEKVWYQVERYQISVVEG